jgi:hypothetical protein
MASLNLIGSAEFEFEQLACERFDHATDEWCGVKSLASSFFL